MKQDNIVERKWVYCLQPRKEEEKKKKLVTDKIPEVFFETTTHFAAFSVCFC
jgi:hypothetical protein